MTIFTHHGISQYDEYFFHGSDELAALSASDLETRTTKKRRKAAAERKRLLGTSKTMKVPNYFEYISNEIDEEEESKASLEATSLYDQPRTPRYAAPRLVVATPGDDTISNTSTKEGTAAPISTVGISTYDEYDLDSSENDFVSYLPSSYTGYYYQEDCDESDPPTHKNDTYKAIASIRNHILARRSASPTGIANLYDEYQ